MNNESTTSQLPSEPDTSNHVEAAIALLSQAPPENLVERFSNELVGEIAEALKNHEFAEKVCKQVFPSSIPIEASFYARLYQLTGWVGAFGKSAEIIGHVWSSALRCLDEEGQRNLMLLVTGCGHSFFQLADGIATVLTQIRFAPEFCMELFSKLKTRIANDGYQRGLWGSIESWALAFPDDAFSALTLLLERQLDDDAVAIGAAILGAVRVKWEKSDANSEHMESIAVLGKSQHTGKRVVFLRSWINTGWIRGISHQEFITCVEQASHGSDEERAEAFNIVRCLVSDGKTTQPSLEFASEWLAQHASSVISANSKHCVVHSMGQILKKVFDDTKRLDFLLTAVSRVMPIPQENRGTWNDLEFLLSELLQRDKTQFTRWVLALLDSHPDSVLKQIRERGCFEHLCSEIAVKKAANLFVREFFSPFSHRRQLAFLLFNDAAFDELPPELHLTDNEVALSLFEFRLHFLQPENTFRFLVMIRARAEKGGEQLVNLFRNELLFQAKNLPRAVLDGLKSLSDQSPLIQQVIADAERYFDSLRKTHGSAINSMEIPGWRRAAAMQGRKQSKAVESHTNEHSILKHLCTNSYLIYGNKGFRYCQDGELGEFAPMKAISVSVEMPRLLMMDEEGERIRRFEAIRFTNLLSKAVQSAKPDSDVS